MSALDALHNEYFDGIPVPNKAETDAPNYAPGLKALARYIDQELRPEIMGRLDELEKGQREAEREIVDRPLQEQLDELAIRIEKMEDLWREREGHNIGPYSLTHAKDCIEELRDVSELLEDGDDPAEALFGHLSIGLNFMIEALNDLVESDADLARRLGDVEDEMIERKNEIDGLDMRLNGVQEKIEDMRKSMAQIRHKVNNRDYQSLKAKVNRDYDGTATAIRELESRLDDLERTVDDVGATADRAENDVNDLWDVVGTHKNRIDEAHQKADDTDELVGHVLEVLDEENLLHYVPSGEVASKAEPAEELSHLEVSRVVRGAFPDASILGSTSAGHPDESFHGTEVKIGEQRYRVSPRLHVEESGDGFLRGTDRAKNVQQELRAEYFKDQWEKGGGVFEALDTLHERTEQEYFLQVRGNGTTWAQLRRSLDDEMLLVAEFKAHKAKRRFKSLLQQRGVTFSTMYHVAGPNGIAFHQSELATDRARTLMLSCLSEHLAVDL